MDKLMLSWRIFIKTPFRNGLLILQLAICLLLFDAIYLNLMRSFDTVNALKPLGIHDSYYVQVSPTLRFDMNFYSSFNEDIDYSKVIVSTLLDNQSSDYDISEIKDYQFMMNPNRNESILVRHIDEFLMTNSQLDLIEGCWQNEDLQINEISMVTFNGSGLKIGDFFEVQDSSQETFRLVVTGILKDNPYIYDFSYGGTPIYAQHLFDHNMLQSQMMFITTSTRLQDSPFQYAAPPNSIVTFNENISESRKHHYLEMFESLSLRYDKISDIVDESYDLALKEVVVLLPIPLFLLMVGLVGLVSMLAISTLNQLKDFAIFYISGMKWKGTVTLIFGYIILLMFSSIGLYLIFKNSLILFWPSFAFLTYNWSSILLVVSIQGVVGLIASLIPLYFLNRNTPSQILKNEEG